MVQNNMFESSGEAYDDDNEEEEEEEEEAVFWLLGQA
jgi:hypothetical protein